MFACLCVVICFECVGLVVCLLVCLFDWLFVRVFVLLRVVLLAWLGCLRV